MSQTRLHVTAPRDAATRIYGALEQAFEDDGFPLAIIEVDEARDIHEVSLYVDEDDLGRAEAEMRRIIGSARQEARARKRDAARHRLGGALAGRPEAGTGRPVLRAWRA